MKKKFVSLGLVLALALGLAVPAMAAPPTFRDMPAGHWANASVQTAAERGIMKGTGDEQFSPDMRVSAAQFLTLVGRVLFPDVKAQGNDWAGPYILAAQEAGLLDGTEINANEPQEDISRYDMAVVLRQAAKLMGAAETAAEADQVADYDAIPEQYSRAVLAVYGMGLIRGDQQGRFNGERAMTRAEVATVAVRLAELNEALAQSKEQATQTPAPTNTPADTSTGTSTSTSTSTGSSEPDLEGARKAFIEGLTNMDEEINVEAYNLKSEEVSALFEEIINADPDGYYVFSYIGLFDRKMNLIGMKVLYHGTKEQYAQYKKDMKEARAKAEEIVATTVHAGMSDYEIAKALHDYIVLNVEYNYDWLADIYDPNAKTGPGDYALYFPLIEHEAICGGYAYAYKYLMDLAGIPCEEIDGKSDGVDEIAASIGYQWGVSHGWNIVQIDGEWYHVDTTWDDLGGDRVRYDYFLKSDKAMPGHYDWESPYPCTSTKYDDLTATLNQQESEDLAARQEAEWAARRAVLMVDFMERFNALPYRSEDGLVGTDELDDDELLSYLHDKVYFPKSEYTYDEMEELYFAVVNSKDEEVFQLNDQFSERAQEDDQWYLVVWRWDIWREYERRHDGGI